MDEEESYRIRSNFATISFTFIEIIVGIILFGIDYNNFNYVYKGLIMLIVYDIWFLIFEFFRTEEDVSFLFKINWFFFVYYIVTIIYIIVSLVIDDVKNATYYYLCVRVGFFFLTVLYIVVVVGCTHLYFFIESRGSRTEDIISSINHVSGLQIGLTQRQINKLKKYTFVDDKLLKGDTVIMSLGEEKICTICLENYKNQDKIIMLDCQHYFHIDCILSWFIMHKTCPLCRNNNDVNL